jgi:hypothetical protein
MKAPEWYCWGFRPCRAALEQLVLIHRSRLDDLIPLIAGPLAAIKLVVVEEGEGKTGNDAALD